MLCISQLPCDIINLIKEYLPLKYLIFTNKIFYKKYHCYIKTTIKNYEKYICFIVERDYNIVFEQIINENINLWLKNKQYCYKNMVFNNYIYYILYLCIENNSDSCREIIHIYLKNRDLLKNLYKKNIIKYIKWKN